MLVEIREFITQTTNGDRFTRMKDCWRFKVYIVTQDKEILVSDQSCYNTTWCTISPRSTCFDPCYELATELAEGLGVEVNHRVFREKFESSFVEESK